MAQKGTDAFKAIAKGMSTCNIGSMKAAITRTASKPSIGSQAAARARAAMNTATDEQRTELRYKALSRIYGSAHASLKSSASRSR